MATEASQPFLWGSGGRRLTPEEILLERKASAALGSEAMSTAPVGHWSQGLNRVLQGLMAGYDSYSADQASKQNGTESAALIQSALGGAPVAPAVTAPVAQSVSTPMGQTAIPSEGNAARAMAFFQSKGMSAEDAAAMVWNFQQESGKDLNPTLSHDGGTGFGIAGFRDPKPGQGRWSNLNKFALERGLDPKNLDAQLEYSWSELQGPENAALRRIQAAQTPEAKAAAAIGYFRPRADYAADRASRAGEVRSLLGGQRPVQVASADPAFAPAAPAGQPAPATQIAQATTQSARPAINPAILKLVSSPYVSDADRKIGMMLLNNQMEQQQKANDPLRALQIQEAQGKLKSLPLELRGKELANTKAERELQGEGAQPLSAEERASYGIPQGQPAYKTRSGEIKFGPAGTKLNVSTGAIPQGYEQFTDPVTGAIRMRPIPGGPKDPAEKDQAKADARATSTGVVTNAAKLARSAIAGASLPATGTAGAVLSNIGETGAAEVYRQVGVLKSNATIENLNAMRAQSPTGGALGNVTEGEGQMLAAKSGSLDPKSPHFQRDLDDYERTLLRVVHGKEQGDKIYNETRQGTTSDGWQDVGGVKIRRKQ